MTLLADPMLDAAEEERRRRREEDALLLLLLFRWDRDRLRYIAPNGRLVPQQAVKNAVNTVITASQQRLAGLARQLSAGVTTLAEWQVAVAGELRLLHLAVSTVAFGGFAFMDADAFGTVADLLRFHLEKLDAFAREIERGFTGTSDVMFADGTFSAGGVVRALTPERISARLGLYARAANATYETIRRMQAVAAGFKYERNILHGNDHCKSTALTVGCVEQTELGWMELGRLVPPGSRTCRMNCLCTLDFARDIIGSPRGFVVVR